MRRIGVGSILLFQVGCSSLADEGGQESVGSIRQNVWAVTDNTTLANMADSAEKSANIVVAILPSSTVPAVPALPPARAGRCTGTLLTSTRVITSASCFEELGWVATDPNRPTLFVHVGGDLSSPHLVSRIVDVAKHPSACSSVASCSALDSDIAVVSLETPVIRDAIIRRQTFDPPPFIRGADASQVSSRLGFSGWSPFPAITGEPYADRWFKRQAVFDPAKATNDGLRLRDFMLPVSADTQWLSNRSLWLLRTHEFGPGPREVGLGSGDRGAPLFWVDDANQRHLVGVASLLGAEDPLVAVTEARVTEIQNHLTAGGVTFDGCIEPSLPNDRFLCAAWAALAPACSGSACPGTGAASPAYTFASSSLRDTTRGARWKSMHPHWTGLAVDWWKGEVDYTGDDRPADDGDLDHSLTKNTDGSRRDNCPEDPNPWQEDQDDNGLGDACSCAASEIGLHAGNFRNAGKICVSAGSSISIPAGSVVTSVSLPASGVAVFLCNADNVCVSSTTNWSAPAGPTWAGGVKTLWTFNSPGTVSTIAGTGAAGADDNASATLGTLNDPAGITVASGKVFVADWGNNSVRVVNPSTGSLTTIARGNPNLLPNPRGEASGTGAVPGWNVVGGGTWSIGRRTNACVDPCPTPLDGSRWIEKTTGVDNMLQTPVLGLSNYLTLIRANRALSIFSANVRGPLGGTRGVRFKVEYLNTGGGVVTTYDSGPLLSTPAFDVWNTVDDQRAIATTAVAVRVSLLTNTNAPTAFDGLQLRIVDAASVTDRRMAGPSAVAVSASGELWVGANGIWRGDTAGTSLTKIADGNGYVAPKRVSSIAALADGYLYFADPTSKTLHVRASNSAWYYAPLESAPGPVAAITGLADSEAHTLWVAFRNSSLIWRYRCLRAPIQGGSKSCIPQSTIGTSRGFSDDLDGTAGGERFGFINGLALGSFGDLFVAEESNQAVRRFLAPLTGTSAGTGTAGFVDGASTAARFSSPNAIAVGSDRSVYVADRLNNRVRLIKW